MRAMGGLANNGGITVDISIKASGQQQAGGQKLNAQSASGALAAYMGQHGMPAVNPDQLYQMAHNPTPGTPPEVANAAKWMLQHPEVFQQIETHDVPGSDGIAGANDLQWAAQGGLDTEGAESSEGTEGADASSESGESTPSQGQQGGAHLNAQSAAGALASYMSQHGVPALTPSQLYKMAFNPQPGTPETVSNAAKFMLKHSSAYQQIETHDVPGSDGVAGANDLQWAAQGGLPSAHGGVHASHSQASETPEHVNQQAQGAAGALASYMSENGLGSLNPDQLYQLAHKPAAGTPPTVAQAAKFMLEHPDTYEQIETHDVAGADGISGKSNFDWAAQGGLQADAAQSTDAPDDAQPDSDLVDNTLERLMKAFPQLAMFSKELDFKPSSSSAQSADAGLGDAAKPELNAQSAAGALAAYMQDKGVAAFTPSALYQLAKHPSADTPATVSDAASFMLKHSHVYNSIETHDVKGSDGKAGLGDFQWAAQGGLKKSAADFAVQGMRA